MKRFYHALKWTILFFACPLAITAQTTVTEVINGLLAPSGTAFYNDVMYVSEYNQNRISMVDLSSSSPTRQTFIDFANYGIYGLDPEGLFLDGTTLYIGNQSNRGLYKVDDISATTPAVTQVAAIPGRIFQMVKRIEGSRHWLYFANHGDGSAGKKVQRIDLADPDPSGTLQDVITMDVNHVALAIYGDLLYTNSNDGIYEADLSTWDPDSYSMNNEKSITETANARSMAFNADGTKMLVLGDTENKVYRYELTSAWDISTATYLGNDIVLGAALSPTAIALVDNRLFVTDISGNDTSMPIRVLGYFLNDDLTLKRYNSSFAFSLETGVDLDPFNPTSITFSGSGDRMYVAHNGNNKRIYQYQLATAWDPSSASSPSFFGLAPANNGGLTSPSSVTLSTGGGTMYVVDRASAKVHQYDLNTAWDITTAIYASVLYNVSAQEPVPHEVAFATSSRMFILGAGDKVYEYATATIQPTEVVTGLGFVTGMALYGNVLYSTDFGTGKVYRMGLGINDYTVGQVTDGISAPLGLSIHDGDLYFSERAAGSVSKTTPMAYTCPADISVTAALGEATAVVTYDDPVVPNSAWSFARTDGPASGEDFPVGETTVTFDVTGPGVSANCTLTVNVYASEWEKVGDFSALSGFDGATKMDLEMDGDVPYIACTSASSGVSVAKFENGAWSFVGSQGFARNENLSDLLEVHGSVPYVAFVSGSKVGIQRFNGTTWEVVEGVKMLHPPMNLEIDGSGYPYMVSVDGSDNSVFARRFDGSSWNPVGTDGFASSETNANWTPLGLAFDGNTPYVAFQDANNLNRATVMKYNGASWASVGGAGISNGTSTKRSLAVDGSNGDLYLAYADESLSQRAVVKKYDGSQWSDVGSSQGISIGAANQLSIEVDANSVPYLVLSDASMNNRATVLRFNGTEWTSVGNAFFSESSYRMSMALDSNGVPHVATFDGDHSSGNGSNIALWAYVPTELGIADASVMEGDRAVFTLSLGRPINEDITVSLSVVDVTTGEGDYSLPESLTVTLEKGHSQTTFEVATLSDGTIEQTETFQVQITGATTGDKRAIELTSSLATGTIIDDGRTFVDTEPPTITILAATNPMYLKVGRTFVDPGAEAYDNIDGDLTEEIEASGYVKMDTAGTYGITYTVSDRAGNEASATLAVIVSEDGTGPKADCDLLGLDSNSFTVSVADETCTGKGNGSVTVTTSAQGTYLVSLDNGTEQAIDGELTFDGLEPGEYRLCARLYGSDCYQCYTVTVREGASIAAGTTARDGLIAVSMRAGTAPFSVRVNGILRVTHSESEFTVAASGGDQVEIASALPCEGTLSLGEELPEKIIAYPNPVSDRLTVEGLQNGNMRFTVLTLSGNTVLHGEMEVRYRSAQLEMGILGPGTYLLLIDQATGATAHRFIKI